MVSTHDERRDHRCGHVRSVHGIKLQDAGIDSFTIFEQASEVGGTWRDNTYPGLHCDVPVPLLQLLVPGRTPNGRNSKPPGPEIQQYFRQVADERNLRPHIRFDTEVTSANYRDGQWWLTTAAGEEPFDVLVTATGFLRVPRYPDIPGRDTFAGPSFHSARWDHSVSLPDKRIGLIGTGSTGVQITSELGGNVRQLKVFQRTAQWIAPMAERALLCADEGGVAALAATEHPWISLLGMVHEGRLRPRDRRAVLAAAALRGPMPVEPAAVGARPEVAPQAHPEGSAAVQAAGRRRPLLPVSAEARRRGDHRGNRPHRAAGCRHRRRHAARTRPVGVRDRVRCARLCAADGDRRRERCRAQRRLGGRARTPIARSQCPDSRTCSC